MKWEKYIYTVFNKEYTNKKWDTCIDIEWDLTNLFMIGFHWWYKYLRVKILGFNIEIIITIKNSKKRK